MLRNTEGKMHDFSKESREDLKELFRCLSKSLEQMNQLPHEMVAMYTSESNVEDTKRLKAFWAEYLEYLAKLVREVSPSRP